VGAANRRDSDDGPRLALPHQQTRDQRSPPVDLSDAIARRPLTDVTEAFSGATLELVELPAGRGVVLKHLPSEGDWLTRATNGSGRVRRLWETGLLARLRPLVDHTVIDVRATAGHDVVVMRDARGDLLPPLLPISRATSRRLLAGLAAIHDAHEGEADEALCAIEARYALFAPAVHAAGGLPGTHPLADRIVQGWGLFAQHVDHDTAAAVFAVHSDPARLARRLARFSPTLLHGDAKLENLGLSSDGLRWIRGRSDRPWHRLGDTDILAIERPRAVLSASGAQPTRSPGRRRLVSREAVAISSMVGGSAG
jgi:hypothetical protein